MEEPKCQTDNATILLYIIYFVFFQPNCEYTFYVKKFVYPLYKDYRQNIKYSLNIYVETKSYFKITIYV